MPLIGILTLLLYIVVVLTVVWLFISALNRMAAAFEDIAYTFRQYTKSRMEPPPPPS
jgi:hypothetical protein